MFVDLFVLKIDCVICTIMKKVNNGGKKEIIEK